MKIAKLIAEARHFPWTNGVDIAKHWYDNDQAIAKLTVALNDSAEALVELVRAARALGSVPHEYSPHDNKECPACANARKFQEALAALPEDWRDE